MYMMILDYVPTPLWFLLWVAVGYVLARVGNHNKRLKALEKKHNVSDRRKTIARLLATSAVTPNEARELLYRIECTCVDLSTPAYPEFAAVMFDPQCPIHGDKNANDA